MTLYILFIQTTDDPITSSSIEITTEDTEVSNLLDEWLRGTSCAVNQETNIIKRAQTQQTPEKRDTRRFITSKSYHMHGEGWEQ